MKDTVHLPNPTGYNIIRPVIGTSIYRDGVTYEWISISEAARDMGTTSKTVVTHIRNGVDFNGYILKFREET